MYGKKSFIIMISRLNYNNSLGYCLHSLKLKGWRQQYKQLSTSPMRFEDFISEFEDGPSSPSHSYGKFD